MLDSTHFSMFSHELLANELTAVNQIGVEKLQEFWEWGVVWGKRLGIENTGSLNIGVLGVGLGFKALKQE